MKLIKSKKALVLLGVLVVAAVASIGAYAYFSSNGSGQGSAKVGTSASLDITQTNTITDVLPDSATHTVAYTIDNTGNSFAQNLGKVTVSDIATSDPTHCLASWFSANDPASAVGTINADSTYTSDSTTQPSIQMNESGTDQDACKGATLTLTLSAAQGS